jgi:allophanate hydrolase
LELCRGFDPEDPFSRTTQAIDPRRSGIFCVPKAEQLEFFGNADYARLYQVAVARCEALGLIRREVDLTPFLEAAQLLYGGPWVAERYAAVGEFIERQPSEATDPTVREIVLGGKSVSATNAFRGQYRLAALKRAAQTSLADLDFLLLPTTPTHYTLEEIASEPMLLNKRLGHYTNFVNLLDLAALAVPAGFTPAGLPFGVTLVGPAFSDHTLLSHAARFLNETTTSDELPTAQPTPATVAPGSLVAPPQPTEIQLAVAGAHLTGQPLNFQLTQRGARLLKTARTAAEYKLYALDGTVPPKPGVVLTPGFSGPGIEVEIWALSSEAFGNFVNEVPQPMTIGTATLSDGSKVKSFLCEPFALDNARDITRFGGWRAYLAATK